MSEPLEEIKRQLGVAREDFAKDVDAIAREVQDFGAAISPALGEVSYDEALYALRCAVITKIDRCRARER